jgi:hypothetical protein
VTVALFPERYDCPTCAGTDVVPAHPQDPGDGWVLPCPLCWPMSAQLGVAKYDPERAEVPY